MNFSTQIKLLIKTKFEIQDNEIGEVSRGCEGMERVGRESTIPLEIRVERRNDKWRLAWNEVRITKKDEDQLFV